METNYITFTEKYESWEDLKTAMSSQFKLDNSTLEYFDSKNWFINIDLIFQKIYNLLKSNSYKKVFIWPTENLESSLVSQFMPALFLGFVNFYKDQLALVKGQLNLLADYKERGGKSTNITDNANSSWTQPEIPTSELVGHKWNDAVDSPIGKSINDSESNSTNIMFDLNNLFTVKLDLNLYSILKEVNWMFVESRWL